jgi:erythritol transport system ATP-binding protein
MTLLAARAVCKQFPGTLALDRVDFQVEPGRVHVLVGENGAGKSTLMRILAGVDKPTSGRVDAASGAIAMIYQELNLLPNMSVADNIFLGRERTRRGFVDRRAEERETADVMARLEQRIAPRTLVGDLPLGQQQIVEIAKALARDARVLIMDEPTSALSAAEIAVLFRLIRDLQSRGVGIVYVSHRLEELLTIGDTITVLRDGRVVAETEVAQASVAWIVEAMTGRAAMDRPPAASPVPQATAKSREAAPKFQATVGPIAISAAAGEIVGFYGLMGAGRTELFETLIGLRRPDRTRISLAGRALETLDIPERLRAGLAMVPEDRKAAGIVPTLSVRENMTLASPARDHRRAPQLAEELQIRCAGLDIPITSLSGGNQQKVLLSRFLMASPQVLLLDDPTRGVDVAARAEIHEIVRALARRGIAVLFASSELEEVLALATRIVVMARGRVTAQFPRAEATAESLVAACGGAA